MVKCKRSYQIQKECIMRTILIDSYNSQWKTEFQKIKNMLYPYISDIIVDIVHVGSTSVPGLPAKPIIDFIIIIDSYDEFPELMKRLEPFGYQHDGDGGIPGRERIKGGLYDGFMDYHMYVCPKHSEELRRQILFRDYLTKYPETAKIYGDLKIRLSQQFPHDIDGYTDGKHEFVENILEEAQKENSIENLDPWEINADFLKNPKAKMKRLI